MLPAFGYIFYRFGKSVWASFKDPEFEGLFSLVALTLGTGGVFYHYQEGWSWLDSFYFSMTTLTTVGYGDLSPHTAGGKLFTIFYLFVRIGVLLGFINFVATHTIDERKGKSFLPWRNRNSDSSAS